MIDKNTSPAKSRMIATVCMILILAATSTYCTQYVAGRLAYHPSLGSPLYGQIYNPIDWWKWSFKYYDHATEIFRNAYLMFGAGAIVALIVSSLIFGFMARSTRKHEGIHGTARFATPEDVKQCGLLPEDGRKGAGVYCGGYVDPETDQTWYLRHNGPEHVIAIAPSQSGKGVGLIIPTLLSCPHSVFVLDPKGENYAITAGWRKTKANNIVLRFEPESPDISCSWNPLAEIRIGTHSQISDAQNIARLLIDNDGAGLSNNNHFRLAAFGMMVGIILHALYKSSVVGRTASLRDCAHMMTDVREFAATQPEGAVPHFNDGDRRPLAALFAEMRNVSLPSGPYSEDAQTLIQGVGRRMENTPERELGSIISTALNALVLYLDKTVGDNTSSSDFTINDLMNAERPVSLYFICTPEHMKRMKPLMRLLLTQITLKLSGKMGYSEGRSKSPHKHRLLLMLDEFPTLGRLSAFETALAFIAGYGIKAYIIAQNIEQIRNHYTVNESITANCHVQIALTPSKIETAEWLSKMAGQTTVIKEQVSTSGQRFGAVLGNVSRSYQEIQRPLMTPDEIRRIPKAVKDKNGNILSSGNMLVFVAGHPVIYGEQILYFRDPEFNRRSRIPAPEKTDTIPQEESKVTEKGFKAA